MIQRAEACVAKMRRRRASIEKQNTGGEHVARHVVRPLATTLSGPRFRRSIDTKENKPSPRTISHSPPAQATSTTHSLHMMRRGKEHQPPAMSAPLLHQSATSHAAVTHTSSHRDVLQRSSGSSHPPHARGHSTQPQQDLQQIDHPRAANSDNGEQGSFCTHCGGSVAPAARFCAICGSRSSQSRAASAARADDHGTAGSELHQSAPEEARNSELHLSSELHVAHELENATRHLSTGIELLSLPARKVDASKGFVRSAVHILLRTASLQSHFALQESVRCWLSNREESFERVSRNRLETSCETLALRVMGGVMHRWQHVQLAAACPRRSLPWTYSGNRQIWMRFCRLPIATKFPSWRMRPKRSEVPTRAVRLGVPVGAAPFPSTVTRSSLPAVVECSAATMRC